jgi:membrane protease YdiL (CAAX protease family)
MGKIENKNSVLKTISYSLLVLASLYSGYLSGSWWKFIPSTLLIVVITKMFFSRDWRKLLGLTGTGKLVCVGIGLCIGMSIVSFFTITYTLPPEFELQKQEFLSYLVPPLQTLNEEMIFRGLLLSMLFRLGWKKWAIILIPALIFSFLHWVFYYHNLSPTNQGVVDFSALITLIFFAVAMNILFVRTGSIILPWAIHLGWNFTRFGSAVVNLANPSERIPEFLTFNLIEGSNAVLLLSTILLGMTIYWESRRNVNA